MLHFSKKIKISLIAFVCIIAIFVATNSLITKGRNENNDTYNQIKKLLPENFKKFLINKIFIFSYTERLEDELKKAKLEIDSVKKQLKNNKVGYYYIKKNGLDFVKFNKEIIFSKYKKDKFQLTTFRNMYLLNNGKRSYLELSKDKIYIISGNGLLNYINLNDLKLDEMNIKFNKIDSNLDFYINEISNDPSLDGHFSKDILGIKGMKVYDKKIYISYVKEVKEDCFTVGVVYADLNYLENLNFEEYFSPKQCLQQTQKTGKFYPALTGGAIQKYRADEILLSVGEFGYLKNAQDLTNIFGKILKIKNDGTFQIVSYGHRNPQGLYYDNEKNIIINSEHGPSGGDEINVNIDPDKTIKNFGWPVSSYGEHDGKNRGFDDPVEYHNDEELYKYAPLHKSHSKYGFIEPIKFFTPSVGPAQLIKTNKDFYKNDNTYVLATMGGYVSEGDQSLYFFTLNKDYKDIIDTDTLNIHDRVRSIIYINI